MEERIKNNKKLIRQFIELVWNQGRLNLANSLITPEFTYHASMIDEPMDLMRMGTMVNALRESFDDFTISVDELVAEGNQIVSQSTLTGTLVKPLMGFEPSDRVICLNAMTFWKVRLGAIQSGHSLLDTADLIHQTQSLPQPGRAFKLMASE
ncbi:ester cyclase [Bacterioplanoides sp.]|uniref:ester cyclase n=1 Tax=Bacterioplanoides sp. TaxID=2066072 RepID=UPI003B005A3F